MSEALLELRARIEEAERLIDACHRNIAILKADLSSMHAVLLVHEQNVGEGFLPHMSVRRLLKRGEIWTVCRAAMLASDEMLDTRELAEAAMMSKGLDRRDRALRKKIVFSVSQALRTARKKRLVVDVGRRKGARLWRVVESGPYKLGRGVRSS